MFFPFPPAGERCQRRRGQDCCGSCPLSCRWRVVQRGSLGELAGAGLLFPPSPLAALRVRGDDCRTVFPSPLLPFLADGVRTGCGGRGRRGVSALSRRCREERGGRTMESGKACPSLCTPFYALLGGEKPTAGRPCSSALCPLPSASGRRRGGMQGGTAVWRMPSPLLSGRERGWSLESDRGWRPSLCAPCPLPLERGCGPPLL